RVGLGDFGLIRVLGKGSMGKVILARKKDTSRLYALKCVNRNYILNDGLCKYVIEEQAILKHISTERDDSDGPTSLHPFVAKMQFSFADSHHLVFVMDVYSGGDLEKLLREKKYFNAALTRFYAMEIVSALEYLNENGIVHRDLKPANILLDCDGHVVVADFGLSKRLTSEAPTSNLPCGSTRYMSPEVIARNAYSYSPDWWALGVMIYEMLTGKLPFPSPPDESSYTLMDKICQSEVVIPKKLPVHTKDIIARLLDHNVVTRLSRLDIKKHPYFQRVDWSKVRAKGYSRTSISVTIIPTNDTFSNTRSKGGKYPGYVASQVP
ncbi:kinase-like protein, partial [Cylindrobasidium torrendii FP15055 ss-10]